MKTLLVISSPRGELSHSTRLWKYAAEQFGWEIEVLDLSTMPPLFLTGPVIAMNYGFAEYDNLSESDKKVANLQKAYIHQLRNVDNVVITAPMWNFSMPASLKAWFDLVIKAGDTFSMDATGYHGHVNNIQKAFVIGSRGGKYIGTDFAWYDSLTSHIKGLLGFIGITQITDVWLEWANMLDESAMTEEVKRLQEVISSAI